MPSTLFSHSDCMARVTLSNVVEPTLTTRMVPSAMVCSGLASAENSRGGCPRPESGTATNAYGRRIPNARAFLLPNRAQHLPRARNLTESGKENITMLVRNSRRAFLAGAATAAATSVAAGRGPILAYAGTYSAPLGAEGAPGRGKGIYLFEMNPATGVLMERALFPNAANPSCLALNASGTRLYSANETS